MYQVNLTGKVALVTGGSRGLGRAMGLAPGCYHSDMFDAGAAQKPRRMPR